MHKRTLKVKVHHSGQYTSEIMSESKDKIAELARKDKERIMLEETRNKFEGYIYHIKNKLIDDEEAISAVST